MKERVGKLPFNKWSRERIKQGRKFCTSRSAQYTDDLRVQYICYLPLEIVRNCLFASEGADSPQEFEQVWRSIHRGKFNKEDFVYVHFGDFREPNHER